MMRRRYIPLILLLRLDLTAAGEAGVLSNSTTTATTAAPELCDRASISLVDGLDRVHHEAASIPEDHRLQQQQSSQAEENKKVSADAASASTSSSPHVYTAFDDASWAVTSKNLSRPHAQALYDDFITECIQLDDTCERDDNFRMYMNANQPQSVLNYTQQGFAKIRAPESLYRLLKEFWDANKDAAEPEFSGTTPYHNTWRVPTTIVKTDNTDLVGGGGNLSAAVWNAARTILEDWTGQKLSGSSVYGIRVYHNQSILLPHVDRMPLISSAIINVDQDVEEDWVLEVYGHDGKATNVTMKPGDMVLYESHSVIHGRPFPLNGRFYANIFVHFEPMGNVESMEQLPAQGDLPPYLIKDSEFEKWFTEEFPSGWELLTDLVGLADRGDLYTLRYVAQRQPSVLTTECPIEYKCSMLSTAIRSNQADVVEFLLEEMGYDVNMECDVFTPLDVADYFFQRHEPVSALLVSKGGRNSEAILQQMDPKTAAILEERCAVMGRAIENEQGSVVEFLIHDMEYDINMICNTWYTPLDLALQIYGEEEEHILFLLEHGAVFYDDMFFGMIEGEPYNRDADDGSDNVDKDTSAAEAAEREAQSTQGNFSMEGSETEKATTPEGNKNGEAKRDKVSPEEWIAATMDALHHQGLVK